MLLPMPLRCLILTPWSGFTGVPPEHQESGKDVPAAAIGQEEIEEVGAAPREEEMPACKHEDKEKAAPEVGAAVPHVRKIHPGMTDY